ncbi:hypothetical protein D3C84_1295070 [compost metagenome]
MIVIEDAPKRPNDVAITGLPWITIEIPIIERVALNAAISLITGSPYIAYFISIVRLLIPNMYAKR